ncbi:MAG: beta-galactosidase [Nocardioides sp.]
MTGDHVEPAGPAPNAVPGRHLLFGGDYNPEQWPAETRAEDIRLMREAGVNLVTLGVFSWARLQPRPGEFAFDWLDEVVGALHEAGIGVDMATATASPPPWLTRRHPEVLPVTADGTTLWPGARQAYCPSSPVFASYSLALCEEMAKRYGTHPAVKLWHVSNELGCHNAWCYCDTSAAAFRDWLRDKYAEIGALNHAWGTDFWSQRYADFDEILPPRSAPAFPNPTQQLDFRRFSSDQLLANYRAERDVIRRWSPDVPVTTNFMVMPIFNAGDYFAWGPEQDVVSNDHYPVAADPRSHRELAFSADLTRGVAGNRPWLVMEHSPSAVNWQPRNIAKRPGELLRGSLAHIARGADAALFFQWRASRAGAEKFHAGLVPHAGTDSRLWREVVELGAALRNLGEVAGSLSRNEVAICFDWNAWWGCELDSHPSVDVRYLRQAHAWHGALLDLGIGVDLVHPDRDLSGYRLVLVPTLYLVTDAGAASIAGAAERGATVLITYFSGIVDEHDHIRLGGYPGAFGDLLGIRVTEFLPLREGERVELDNAMRGSIWAEDTEAIDADVVARFADGPGAGRPAITRRAVGAGSAWYVATDLAEAGIAELCRTLTDEAGIRPVAVPVPDVEFTARVADESRWVFAINHADAARPVELTGFELLSRREVSGTWPLPAGSVAVVRTSR